MIMNEYERHYWRIMVDLALTRSPSEIVPTIWKYTKKVMLYMCDESLFDEKQAPFGYFRNINFGVAIKGIQFYTTYPEFPYVEAAMKHLEEYQEELLKCNDFQKYVKYMKKWEDTPKYELGKQKSKDGKTFYKIRALKPFSFYYRNKFYIVKKGEDGGWVSSESNLSQKGNCWIDKDSVVADNARVEDNALVFDSRICGNVIIKDFAIIKNNSFLAQNVLIEKKAIVDKSDIFNNALVTDNAYIYLSKIVNNVEVYGYSKVYNCELLGSLWIEDSELNKKKLSGNKKIKGETNI